MKTARGVYTNISESEYKLIVNGLVYYFSSMFYLNKFKNNVKEFVETETLKFNHKYKVQMSLDLYFTICYYKQVEKRGFLIYDPFTEKEITEDVVLGNQLLKY